ncbi:MAG: VanW family protein [Clostridia bacterium]|nr:VanW family protein [Clostridia bacterium]
MFKHHRFAARAAALLMAVLLLVLEPFAVLAEEQEEPITHIATSTVALKVRRTADKNSSACDSIPRGSFVYITEFGNEWCKVRTQYSEGYVLTKYLTEILVQEGFENTETPAAEAEPVQPVEPVGEIQPGFTTNESNFREGYRTHALVNATMYESPSATARRVREVPIYEEIIVSEVSGDWCLARYNGSYGYMRNDTLFKWDRIDPYAGEIPGCTVWPYLAFVKESVAVRDLKSNKELKTINPGAAICVGEKDEFGRYPTPYHRTTGYVLEDQIAWMIPVKDWESAQSGDLISAMTTYYGVGVSTLQYQGRNWNIRLSSTYITGTILQPGQEYNQNQVIAPYRKSTGYKEAPIMSDDALSGYGGGTCQTNTTFYNAVIQLPLLVKHRRVHADVGMEYIPQGFDAAVGGGAINLIMENTLPYAIRFQCFISDGVLTICIFKV